jgi:hypothetical protein
MLMNVDRNTAIRAIIMSVLKTGFVDEGVLERATLFNETADGLKVDVIKPLAQLRKIFGRPGFEGAKTKHVREAASLCGFAVNAAPNYVSAETDLGQASTLPVGRRLELIFPSFFSNLFSKEVADKDGLDDDEAKAPIQEMRLLGLERSQIYVRLLLDLRTAWDVESEDELQRLFDQMMAETFELAKDRMSTFLTFFKFVPKNQDMRTRHGLLPTLDEISRLLVFGGFLETPFTLGDVEVRRFERKCLWIRLPSGQMKGGDTKAMIAYLGRFHLKVFDDEGIPYVQVQPADELMARVSAETPAVAEFSPARRIGQANRAKRKRLVY